jgi:hypothetical protein
VLNLETHFTIKEEFNYLEATKWAVREIKRWGLASLFQRATDTAYQRHVKLFYQNLSFDCEWPKVLSTSLDGVHLEIIMEDIALALKCPHECPQDLVRCDGTPHYGIFPIGLTVQEMVDDMCGGR